VKKIGGAIWVFYANDCGTAGYRLRSPSAGKFRLARAWFSRTAGTTPVLAHGVLYVAHDSALTALNPTTGAAVGQAGIGSVHWEYPRVAGKRIFVTDHDGKVYAFRIG
jgi:outer membrane protein assembly factor BamB